MSHFYFRSQFFSEKILWELILPVKTRINDVRNFLMSIDNTLSYEVLAIQDPFGPTKTVPDLDVCYQHNKQKIYYIRGNGIAKSNLFVEFFSGDNS